MAIAGTENLGIQRAVTETSWTGLGANTSLYMGGGGENSMVVRIDNTYPVMTINSISCNGE